MSKAKDLLNMVENEEQHTTFQVHRTVYQGDHSFTDREEVKAANVAHAKEIIKKKYHKAGKSSIRGSDDKPSDSQRVEVHSIMKKR